MKYSTKPYFSEDLSRVSVVVEVEGKPWTTIDILLDDTISSKEDLEQRIAEKVEEEENNRVVQTEKERKDVARRELLLSLKEELEVEQK